MGERPRIADRFYAFLTSVDQSGLTKENVGAIMSGQYYPPVASGALSGSMRDFRVPGGTDILARVNEFYKWQEMRRQAGVWPFSRSTVAGPRATVVAQDDRGNAMRGVNFASQDYLSLSAHPAIQSVALETIERYGVHSAGSAALVGNTTHSIALERKIADFLMMKEAVLYPTGWGAGYGAIRGLVRSADHIVIDALAHTCLQEGASAATRNIYLHRHLDVEHCRHWLRSIRAKDTANGIMVVTESLFSMDSDTPDIKALQELCHEYGATLLVDVAHDLGALGKDGRGHIGLQGMLGKVDLVMGSFSKTFASNGGFVACQSRAVKEYLRFYSPTTTFSNALSQVQAAVALKAFEIVESSEGAKLREALMANILNLRGTLRARGMDFYGDPSAIVAVKTGSESLARLVSRRLPELGLLANLVEYPAVGKGAARFRMQVMANHTADNVAEAVDRIEAAYHEAKLELADNTMGEYSEVA
jgi:7-keto-8-aminopelargonate synthetase-like enzyme